ncbi:MAG TPA: family 78 glycoside hydrolase catalytic domain [Clostridiales bacterium]|nr:family 78 glycoside hydrolase catalytic domain [Clostridiales bacterium]
MKAIRLQTEYLTEPLGIDIREPRFYWNCEGGLKQTAYQILAMRSGAIIWDSNKIVSDRMTHIKYKGELLGSRDIINWKVKLWDENDVEGEWSESFFEMGLLQKEDWKAEWITGNYKPKKDHRYPVDCFSKSFTAKENIRRARLYITACGLYEAKLNGKRIGSFSFAPGCTDYRFRIQYQAYDVTSMLQYQNRFEIQLADGWYRGSIGCFGLTGVFGKETKLLSQLEIVYEDGSVKTVCSDGSFAWSNDGPIRFADLKDGEIYEADRTPSYNKKARVTTEKLVPTASNNVEIREKERFRANLIVSPSGKKILDFGQNIAGIIEFTVKGQKGQEIKLRLGEILDENGELTQKNFQHVKPAKNYTNAKFMLLMMGKDKNPLIGETVLTPKQEVEFFCSGDDDHYKTSFAVFGFRYAEIETDVEFDASQFYAIAVYSDLEQIGTFTCSNDKINRVVENTIWSMKGNYLDVPTDCPTRERMGWTGDAQVFFRTGTYFMNTAPFFRKWLIDLSDNQYKNGKISAVAPYQGGDMLYNGTGGSVGFLDAAILIPYRYWKIYGDEAILQDCYPMMKRCSEYLIRQTGHKNKKDAEMNPFHQYTYEKGTHLGEWLEPKDFQANKVDVKSLHTEECTAYLHYTMSALAEIAHCLGKPEDEELFQEYAEGAKKAYNWLFLKDGTIDTDRQAKLVRPLALGLLDGEIKRRVQERLTQAVKSYRYRVGTGFLSTSFLLTMLSDAGHSDIAYKMLENEETPGWLAQVNAGATTIWENWDGEASRNHYAPGSFCEWLFHTAAGIRVIAENQFEIRPVPGGTLNYVAAEHKSIYGLVKVSWQKGTEGYEFACEIPCNTRARVILPDGRIHEIGCGKYNFK